MDICISSIDFHVVYMVYIQINLLVGSKVEFFALPTVTPTTFRKKCHSTEMYPIFDLS